MKKVLYIAVAIISIFPLVSSVKFKNTVNLSYLRDEKTLYDGVYEFEYSTLELTHPVRQSHRQDTKEWIGRYYFVSGKYSFVMMRLKRAYLNDPSNEDKIGYISHSGEYKINGTSLELTKTFSLNPLDSGRTVYYGFTLKDKQLTLTQVLSPSIHDMREGLSTAVYRRLD